ncbi:conserved phage C-terminal domain-containing protein [Budviciaceae bacterium BWR-B9]|uniref:Conserved phage C-terminal domain-containing protein n=1 Tax=Limnobaculum allomyrinae TaxID=2791986 RepID=A0ABS1IW83_9GAMM|nr:MULTISPECIES: conserved phage C-terminal domain-containing protein [Limnobaculum]MBK5146031.1 conserved phage C-terminal domain-containing protein [Limnobaculum allomyrinae]MBV7694076.1 conserved phage C-terminal domain-containing protein [Limnobaculum sp. M2-1]
MSLLLNSRPIIVIPELAVKIGLPEAVLLQQVHYWLTDTTSGIDHDGRRWIYNTIDEWVEQFPFWSASTIKRAFAELKRLGIVFIEQLSSDPRDKTNFYSINYEHHILIDEVKLTPCNVSKCTNAKAQNDPMQKSKLKRCKESKRPLLHTEITTENNKTPCPAAEQPDPATMITDQAKQVLNHLNLVTGSKYQPSKTSLEGIRARLVEGFTPSELLLVVDYTNEKWGDDLKMSEYLRPITLFSPSKFPGYLQAAEKWNESGRPEYVNGKWMKDGKPLKGSGVDNSERDAAYRRYTSGVGEITNPSQLEIEVRKAAGKAGIRNQQASFAQQRWNSLWTEYSERLSGNSGEAAA